MTEFWDATRIKNLKNCPRFFHLRYVEGWRPPTTSVHIGFGGAFAKALEVYRRGNKDADAAYAVIDSAEFEEVYPKTKGALIEAFRYYIDHYRNDTLHIVGDVPAAEVNFEVDVDDDIVFCGYLDSILKIDGRLYVVDQKTTSRGLTSHYFRQFTMDDQMFMYAFAAKALIGSPVAGVIVDAIQIGKKGEIEFLRRPVVKTPAQLEEWYRDTLTWIRSARAYTLGERATWPKNISSCLKYGQCDFFNVCSGSPKSEDKLLKVQFMEAEVWDPSKKR